MAPDGVCCSVVSGDFNGDGKLDLAVVHNEVGAILLLRDGSGGFVMRTVPGISGSSRLIAAADFDRNGTLDLLLVTYSGNPCSGSTCITSTAYLLPGNGDGTFAPAVTVGTDEPEAVADFNGDGIPDLLFAGSGGFYSRLGNGDGTFRPAAALTMFSASFPTSTAVGDLNGDGKADVVWSHAAFDGVISVYLGNGDGTFRATPSLLHPHDPNGWGDMYGSKPIAIADFNRDGKADLAVLLNSGYSYASVAVLNGQGDGEFEQGFSGFTLVGVGISASDFNADGNLDIASGPSVLLGNGDGSFQVPAYFPGDRPMAAALAEDFNGDGLPDLVLIPSFLAAPGIHFDPTGTGPDLLINNSPGNPASVAAVSSVNGAEMISPGSLASIYGSDLATGTASPTPGTAPTALGGIRLRIHDSSGETEFAKLVYVSPTQINFVVPEGAATGWSIFTIDRGTEPVVEGTRATLVTDLAPGFFTVDGRLNGVAAATAIRIGPDGQQEPVEVFSCNGSGSCTATPLDLRNGAVYLSLYGTGFRRVEDPFCLVLTGNRSYGAITSFSGPHPFLPGLDQVNLLLPPMIPSGLAWVECTFDPLQGPANSNAVQVAIK